MTSLSRMLAVLDLFDEGASVWTAEAIAQRLGYTLPTGYRYVRELTEAGLLRRDAGGTYVLGPRVIELDHRIRIGDPLLIAGQRVMRDLADETGCDVVLGTIYGERIITIDHEYGDEGFAASYGRGRRMPLFRGMLSKAILSALPRAALRRLHEHHRDEAAAEALAKDWDTLVANLKAIRTAGYSTSHGELDPGGSGIAVALSSPPRRLVAALGFVMSQRRFRTADEGALVAMLTAATARIVAALPPLAHEPGAAPKRRGSGMPLAA
jgi:DNA-binding IclR family transcriptional regulator